MAITKATLTSQSGEEKKKIYSQTCFDELAFPDEKSK